MKLSEFEEGNKRIPEVVLRRIAKTQFLSETLPEVVDLLSFGNCSNQISNLRADLSNKMSAVDPRVMDLLQRNFIYFPDEIFLRASPYHTDSWGRDSFYTALSINDPMIEMHLLERSLGRGYRYPQVPTTRIIFSDREWFFDDETTALSLTWRAKIAKLGFRLRSSGKQAWQDRFEWLQSHCEDGSYITPAGTERSWFDTFNFPEPDILSYNQGIYAVATLAAERLGLKTSPNATKDARLAYQKLTHPSGRLQFSKNYPYKDASSLTGEYLALTIFGESLLDDETVLATESSLDSVAGGYKVVTTASGEFLDASQFNRPYLPGDYHNGADWPFFSATTRRTAELHGLKADEVFWRSLFNNLASTRSAEYRRLGVGSPYDPQREDHCWNALAYILAAEGIRTKVNPRTFPAKSLLR